MARTVLLPRELESRLSTLALLNEEVNGVLFYQRQGDSCPIDSIFVTGVGDEGHVQSVPARLETVNAFLRKVPDYDFIKFHTHSKETIARFGEHYATNFSQGDMAGIHDQLKSYPGFMHLLVTPKAKILYGRDNPRISVVQTHQGYEKRSQAVNSILMGIAKKLGYELNLSGTL